MDFDRQNAARRRITFTLDKDANPNEPVVLTTDISAALIGNWGDDRKPPKDLLKRFRVTFDSDSPPPVIEKISIENDLAAFSKAPAGVTAVELRGSIKRSWYANAGATVRFTVKVPDMTTELRWHDAGHGGAQARVHLVDGDERTELFAPDTTKAAWRLQRRSLAAWSGRTVTLELSNAGSDTALFGDPRLVAAGGRDPSPDIVLLMIDTMRADTAGAWGNQAPNVTPNLDRLSREGLMFAHAVSTSPWTKPAIPSLMTGLRPTTHRVGSQSYADKLPPGVPMLQDQLSDAGWRTGSFSSSPLGSTLSGLERGFDHANPPRYWNRKLGKLGHVSADQLSDAMIRWWGEERDRPMFAYLHTLEVHGWRRGLYKAPPSGMDSYDYSVHDADKKLGKLIDRLSLRKSDRDLLVVVVSDHGEGFGDHGRKNHGSSLYHSQVHIPMLFWSSKGALPSGTITDPVSLVDVAPTILDLVGAPPLPDVAGISLQPYFDNTATEPLHAAVPSTRIRYVWTPKAPIWHSLVTPDGLKAVRVEGTVDRVFDLGGDLCEGSTTPASAGDLFVQMDEMLADEGVRADAFDGKWRSNSSKEMDAGDIEMLRELGYLEE